jgi:hypothetical protein
MLERPLRLFLPAAINEVDGLRHWNDNSPPSPWFKLNIYKQTVKISATAAAAVQKKGT